MAETTAASEFVELIPDLPEELALECLTRLHYSAHGVAFRVCKKWLGLLQSKEFYYHRKNSGLTRKVACLIQALPPPPTEEAQTKPVGPPSYGISVFDPASEEWDRVDPIPRYPDGLPLFCQVASAEGRLFVIGGWDPSTWDPVRGVFMYEFTTRRWTQCADMPSARSFFAVGAAEGKVVVAGGHDESKNALRSAWAYDVESNLWSEIAPMSEGRDECEGVFIGSGFWVVSGYDTDAQGSFKSSAEVYELGSGEWRRVENGWRATQCPRSCVSAGQNGQLTCWAESDPAVRVGTCGVDLGEVSLVTGAQYQGATHGFFLAGQNGKLRKIEVPEEFSGFVQSGCFVEI